MSEAADPFGWVGHVIADKYRVDAAVAEGGFAIVYRAHHLGLGEAVALKCLKVPRRLEGAEREKFLESFLAEGRLLHQLSRQTTGIVQALDAGAAQSPSGLWTPYLVLEWLDGIALDVDLAERARSGHARRSLAEAMQLLEPVARALSVAHERGVAHRDIKPANLFLATIDGRRVVKVVDFGIAKVISDVSSITRALEETGASMQAFTPQYGAPEQFHKKFGATGPWTDVFALTLVLVEMLTGEPALAGDTTQLFVAASDTTHRPTPRAFGITFPDAVDAVLAKALAVEPKERYRTAGEMWDALAAVASTVDTSTSPLASTQRLSLVSAATVLAPVASPPSTSAPIVATAAEKKAGSGRGALVVGALGAVVCVAALFAFVATRASAPASPPSPPPALSSSAANKRGGARASTFERANPTVVVPHAPSSELGAVPQFVAGRFPEDDGLSFFDAQRACMKRGLIVCTNPQWARACEVDAAFGALESWTTTLTADYDRIFLRGGGGCGAREASSAEAHAAERVGICCERAVPMRASEGAGVHDQQASRTIAELESAIAAHDSLALADMMVDGARLYDAKRASRADVERYWAAQFQKSADFWIVHPFCELSAPDAGTWKASCRKIEHETAGIGLMTAEYLFDSAAGKLKSIADVQVLRPMGPI